MSLEFWAPVVLLFVVGLCVGSFINVVVHRLPLMMQRAWEEDSREILGLDFQNSTAPRLSLYAPASHCPHCLTQIQWRDNIPLLSFLLLRGRCRYCSAHIAIRYPTVELIAACLAALLVVRWGFTEPVLTFAYIGLAWLLLTLALIDLETQLLPDILNYLILWSGLLLHAVWQPELLQDAVLATIAGYLFFWTVYQSFRLITGRDGLGYGDFKLLAALGAWFGLFCLVPIILISSVLGISYALYSDLPAKVHSIQTDEVLNNNTAIKLSQPFAFGPFLAFSGVLCVLIGPERLRQFFFV